MKKIAFTGTDLFVSPLALGTTGFGERLDEKASCRQMDAFVDAGGNFFDTAYVYGCFGCVSEMHASEKYLGRWLKARGNRDKVVISTKGGHPLITDAEFTPRLSMKEVVSDLEESLVRLHTDSVDMYFLHRDDRSKPVGEIVEMMEEIRKTGKIRYYGFSNWKVDRAEEARAYAAAHGLQGFSANQLMWSLAHITEEEITDKTLVPMDGATYLWHAAHKLPAMAYRSMAKGYFARRFKNASIRKDLRPVFETGVNDEIYNGLLKLSEETGLGMTLLSLLYFVNQPFPSVAIASFSNDEQLKEGLEFLQYDDAGDVASRVRAFRRDLTAPAEE